MLAKNTYKSKENCYRNNVQTNFYQYEYIFFPIINIYVHERKEDSKADNLQRTKEILKLNNYNDDDKMELVLKRISDGKKELLKKIDNYILSDNRIKRCVNKAYIAYKYKTIAVVKIKITNSRINMYLKKLKNKYKEEVKIKQLVDNIKISKIETLNFNTIIELIDDNSKNIF